MPAWLPRFGRRRPALVALKDLPTIQVDDIHQAFTRILNSFRPRGPAPAWASALRPWSAPLRKSPPMSTSTPWPPSATDVEIGPGSTIHSGVHVMAGSKIGADVTIFPNAVLYEDTVVGPRCVIHAGAVLGAYGFGYACVNGRHRLSAQLGHVVLGADVEIGAGTTIDRGTYGPTVIGEGTKIDDQVMVAHNCRIGRHNLLCSQVGIAGSTCTGDYVVMAGQVGVRDHVHIGDRAVLGAMAGVINDVPAGAAWSAFPPLPNASKWSNRPRWPSCPRCASSSRPCRPRSTVWPPQLESHKRAEANRPAPEDCATD